MLCRHRISTTSYMHGKSAAAQAMCMDNDSVALQKACASAPPCGVPLHAAKIFNGA